MTMFGFFMFKPVDGDTRAAMQSMIEDIQKLAYVAPDLGEDPPAAQPLPGVSSMNGSVQWGAVTIEWVNGVPGRASRVINGYTINGYVPARWWDAVRANAPEQLWVPFTYLAFPESDYIENAHNPHGEDSWGALQVNRDAWPQYSVAELSTYAGNIRAAVAIYNLQGYGAWFNSATLVGLI